MEGEAVCMTAKPAITKGGAMCKCQAEACNARRAVQGSEKAEEPTLYENREATGIPRGATPPFPKPSSLKDAAGKGAGSPRPVGGPRGGTL